MNGYFFIEIVNNQVSSRGRVISDMGRGNYAIQIFGQDGRPDETIPVRVITSDQMVNSLFLFPTAEAATAFLVRATADPDGVGSGSTENDSETPDEE